MLSGREFVEIPYANPITLEDGTVVNGEMVASKDAEAHLNYFKVNNGVCKVHDENFVPEPDLPDDPNALDPNDPNSQDPGVQDPNGTGHQWPTLPWDPSVTPPTTEPGNGPGDEPGSEPGNEPGTGPSDEPEGPEDPNAQNDPGTGLTEPEEPSLPDEPTEPAA